MTPEEIEAIVDGYHGDSFRVLGPHSVGSRQNHGRWEVRAFLPQAESAEVVAGEQRVAMQKQHAEGFFCGTLAGDPASYRIHMRLPGGAEVEIDDPYRYGPQLSESDLYLHTEGTLYESWRVFGAHLDSPDGVA